MINLLTRTDDFYTAQPSALASHLALLWSRLAAKMHYHSMLLHEIDNMHEAPTWPNTPQVRK